MAALCLHSGAAYGSADRSPGAGRPDDGWEPPVGVLDHLSDHPAPPVDILVTFREIRVDYDGDKNALNKGELSFSWGFDGVAIGALPEKKMHAGTTISLHQDAWQTFSLGPDDTLPTIGFAVRERDPDLLIEFCSQGYGIPEQPTSEPSCDTTVNVAHLSGLGLETIADLPTCEVYDIDSQGLDDRCALLVTPNPGADWARARLVVAFIPI